MYGTYLPALVNPWYGTHMNPLKQFRLQSHLTQQELADKLGLTRQTILDTEQGLFPVVPPSIARSVPFYIQHEYRTWVREERQNNTKLFAVELTKVGTFEDYAVAVGGSVRGFARVLVIQTSIVRDYIRNGERWNMIESALVETGMPTDFIIYLSKLERS